MGKKGKNDDHPEAPDAEMRSEMRTSGKLMNQMDGKESKDDKIIIGLDDAKQELMELLESKKILFTGFPFEDLKTNIEQLCEAYCLWSQKDPDVEQDRFNVTKAYLRMEAFNKWVEEYKDQINTGPVTREEAQRILRHSGFFLSENLSKDGHLMWLFSIDRYNMEAMQKFSVQEQLRAFVWLFVAMSLDADVQKHGVVIVEGFSHKGLMFLMRMMDKKVKQATDKLLMGCGAIKMKKIYIIENTWFMKKIMGFFSLFISKKMRDRFELYNDDWDRLYGNLGGADLLPEGFGPHATGSTSCRWFKDDNHFATKTVFEY